MAFLSIPADSITIAELKKKNAEREAAEKRIKELEEARALEQQEQKLRAQQAQGECLQPSSLEPPLSPYLLLSLIHTLFFYS